MKKFLGYCNICGKDIETDFCDHCGKKVKWSKLNLKSFHIPISVKINPKTKLGKLLMRKYREPTVIGDIYQGKVIVPRGPVRKMTKKEKNQLLVDIAKDEIRKKRKLKQEKIKRVKKRIFRFEHTFGTIINTINYPNWLPDLDIVLINQFFQYAYKHPNKKFIISKSLRVIKGKFKYFHLLKNVKWGGKKK